MTKDIFQALQIVTIVLIATFIAYCVDQSQWGLLLLIAIPSLFAYSLYKGIYYFMTETGKQTRETRKALKDSNNNKGLKHDYK